MKKFWCLFLFALLLGCTPQASDPVILASASPVPVEASTPEPTTEPTAEPTADPTPEPTEPPTPEPTPEPTLSPEERLYAYIDGMSAEEKIGQLCMFGFSGTQTISSEFQKILKEYHIGSVILYGQNMERTNSDGGFSRCRALTGSVRNASESEIPLLISTDVEGGSVTRFRWRESLLSARTLGKQNDPDAAADQFRYIAQGLLSAGTELPVLTYSRRMNSYYNIRSAPFAAELKCGVAYSVEDFFVMAVSSSLSFLCLHLCSFSANRALQFFYRFVNHLSVLFISLIDNSRNQHLQKLSERHL